MNPVNPAETTEAAQIIGGLRDGLRSARFWRELMTPTERHLLLADIARVSLLLARDGRGNPARDGDIAAGKKNAHAPACPACPLERLAFLQSVWPQMEAALTQIEAAPPQVLRPAVRLVETAKARRVSPKAVLDAVREGRDFVPVPPDFPNALARLLGGKMPRRVGESAVAPCVDTPANRALKTVLVRFARDVKAIGVRAEACELSDAARQAAHLHKRIRRHLTAPLLRDLPPAPLRGGALRAALLPLFLRSSPPHRALHDVFWRYGEGFSINWNQAVFQLPAEKTWLLYEMWCAFTIAETLHTLGFCLHHDNDLPQQWLAWQAQGLTCKLETGRASRLVLRNERTGQTVTLFYNRYFERGAGSGETGWHSRARALRPDIVLEASGRLLILDAKWKTYAQPGWEGSDIEQMHTYRDAIARGNQRNPVRAAWLLYAGSVDAKMRRPIIAYPKSAPGSPLGNGEVGALCLRPGATAPNAALTFLIEDFLQAALV